MAVAAFPLILSPQDAERLFAALSDETVEVVGIAYLDAAGAVLGVRHSRSLSCHAVALPIRAIVSDALAFDADALLMAHNHPAGIPRPSPPDIEATRKLARALDLIDVRLHDHLVIARGGNASFRALGLL